MHKRIQRYIPLRRLRRLILWSKSLKPLAAVFPRGAGIALHGADDVFLAGVVYFRGELGEAVDVEHCEVGEDGNDDDDVDEGGEGELVVYAPERLWVLLLEWGWLAM